MRSTQIIEQCCSAILKRTGNKSIPKAELNLIVLEECDKFGCDESRIKLILNL